MNKFKSIKNKYLNIIILSIITSFLIVGCSNFDSLFHGTRIDIASNSKVNEHIHNYQLIKEVEGNFEQYGYKVKKCTICSDIQITDIHKDIDTSYLQPHYLSDDVVEGRSGWLFLIGNGDFPYYLAENILADEEMQNYKNQFTRFVNICKEKNKEVIFLIIPNKSQVYSEYMPTLAVKDEYKRTRRFIDYLNNNSNIKIKYIIDELNYGKIFHNVYCKYDSHLNNFGSYIAAKEINRLLGTEVYELNYYELEEGECNGGDLIGLAKLNVENYPKDKDVIVDYKPDVEVTYRNATDPVLAGIYKTKSTSENKKNMVYIGDSFRVRLIPYLEKDFSNATFIHLFNIEEIESTIENSDLIIIELVERYDYLISNITDRILRIINRP